MGGLQIRSLRNTVSVLRSVVHAVLGDRERCLSFGQARRIVDLTHAIFASRLSQRQSGGASVTHDVATCSVEMR